MHQIHVTQVLRFGGFFSPNRKSKRAVAQVTRNQHFTTYFQQNFFPRLPKSRLQRNALKLHRPRGKCKRNSDESCEIANKINLVVSQFTANTKYQTSFHPHRAKQDQNLELKVIRLIWAVSKHDFQQLLTSYQIKNNSKSYEYCQWCWHLSQQLTEQVHKVQVSLMNVCPFLTTLPSCSHAWHSPQQAEGAW